MVSSEKKLANAVGGKTARACDSCIRKRARWYCAADDVFLCQFCDALVHSAANPLAHHGHERVGLKIASVKLTEDAPTWHQGFRKKSRTPRGNKHGSHQTPNSKQSFNPSLHLVPEIGSDNDDQFLYQVPVFDESEVPFHMNGLILPSDLELAEFAADVESLLGKSLDKQSLGILDSESIKVEEEVRWEAAKNETEMMRDPFQLSFDYDSTVAWEVEDEKEDAENQMGDVKNEDEECEVVDDDHVNIHTENYYDNAHDTSKKNMKMSLKLDYEGVIAAWDDHRSPWTTGDRPELDPDCMVGLLDCRKMHHYDCGDMGMMRSKLDVGGREARVSRYREKRRRRLFSKKIRYEVRKLNAEKRPRMKGRFVKRSCAVPLLSK